MKKYIKRDGIELLEICLNIIILIAYLAIASTLFTDIIPRLIIGGL